LVVICSHDTQSTTDVKDQWVRGQGHSVT